MNIIFEDITFNVEIFSEMEKGSLLWDVGEKMELTPFPECRSSAFENWILVSFFMKRTVNRYVI